MKKIKACFSATYYAPTPTASMKKLPLVAAEVQRLGYAELIDPGSIDPEILAQLHDPDYVKQFCTGEGRMACSQGWAWTPEIRNGVLAINAGQIRAAEIARKEGFAANIGQGFHHAGYSSGGGFCTFNGIALVAKQYPKIKVGVLDCDEHQGNGTADFTNRFENLYNFTIHGTSFGAPEYPRSINRELPAITNNFKLYLESLEEGFLQIQSWGIELLIYQAGADPHIDDPLNSLGMTSEQMFQRDRMVFEFIKRSKIPSFFVRRDQPEYRWNS